MGRRRHSRAAVNGKHKVAKLAILCFRSHYPAVSVTHYFEQNGDLCQDPEMCFELIPHGAHVIYEPYLFQQAIPPLYQEVFATGAENIRLKRQLLSFAQQWDRNLRDQGFESAAAKLQTQPKERA
jgi:hypothetical protein